MIPSRYERNFPALSEEEWEMLAGKKVCVVGCGGLGGYILESLVRIGVRNITVIDGDSFEESNLNRQIISREDILGHAKAGEAQNRAKCINSHIKIHAIKCFLTKENAEQMLAGHDMVFDGVDNLETRRIMGEACGALHIPLMYGAIREWYGQIALIRPGDNSTEILCPSDSMVEDKSVLPFTAAICGSLQVAEGVKYLIGRKCMGSKELLYVDLLTMEMESVKYQ